MRIRKEKKRKEKKRKGKERKERKGKEGKEKKTKVRIHLFISLMLASLAPLRNMKPCHIAIHSVTDNLEA